MTNAPANTKSSTDFLLFGVAVVLTCLGILLIFDASYGYCLAQGASVFKFVTQQAIWAVVGIAALLVVARIPIAKWRPYVWGLAGISFLMLLVVWMPHLGVMRNGAHRWIGHFQPSEIAKLAVVLMIAHACAAKSKLMGDFKRGPLPILLIAVAAFAAVIEREPDLGTAMVLTATGLATLYFAGMKTRHLVACAAVGAVLVAASLMFKHDPQPRTAASPSTVAAAGAQPAAGPTYRENRIATWLDPEKHPEGSSFQVLQGLIGLGSGGFTGMGIGTGREKYYLPESYTDSIFAILGEETGLVGTLFVIVLYVILIARGMQIAERAKDPFAAIVAGGISAAFGIQALLNLCVVTSIIPATGVPLPFLSYGGTSLLLSLVFVGILMSIHRYSAQIATVRGEPAKAAAERGFDARWDRGVTLSRPEYGRVNSPGPAKTRKRPVGTR